MSQTLKLLSKLLPLICVIVTFPHWAKSQTFVYQKDDLVVGFRKTGSFQASYELVVDAGQVTNYLSMAPGTSVTVPNFTLSQLSDAFPNLNNLNWSVLAGDSIVSPAGYPSRTIWLTVPRTNVTVQTSAPLRLSKGSQQAVGTEITSILAGAAFISGAIGLSNQDNTASLVREPINSDSDLSVFVASQSDSTQSTLHDTWSQNNVEITTPGSFSNPVRSDFYEVRPVGVLDPHTGLTNGAAYYAGYFEFSPSGTMTFTRGAFVTPPPPPPPPGIVSATRSGNTSTIYFTTTNGATYSLYYTNTSGLGAPVSSWTASSNTVIGNGGTTSLSDTTTDAERFYRVGAR